jgi:hypothetical protein
MSNIKQERHFTSTSQFPVTGAENVEYTARAEVYGLDWYWDKATGAYKRKIGNILSFPYINGNHPYLDTIKKALDFLLAQELTVVFGVKPSYVTSVGNPQELTFQWAVSKIPASLSSVIITTLGYNSGNLLDTMSGTSGALTTDITISGITEFTITVVDTDGNTAQATDTVNVESSGVTATLTIAPTTYDPSGDPIDVVLTWTVDQYVENLEELYITDDSLIPVNYDVLELTTNTPGDVGCAGSKTLSNKTYSQDTNYTLFAKVDADTFTQVSASIDYLDADITFSVTENDSPVSGATISIKDSDGAQWGNSWTTSTNGTVMVENIPYGEYTATVTKTGYVTETDVPFAVSGDATVPIALELDVNTVTFTAYNDLTLPSTLSGVTVAVNGTTKTTDGSGVAEFNLADGTYTYTASKTGFVTGITSLTVSGDTDVTLNMITAGVISNLIVTGTVPGSIMSISYIYLPTPAFSYEGLTTITIDHDELGLPVVQTKGDSGFGTYSIPAEWTGNITITVQGEAHNGALTNVLTGEYTLDSNVYVGHISSTEAADLGTLASVTSADILSNYLTEADILGGAVLSSGTYSDAEEPFIDFMSLLPGVTSLYPWVAFPQGGDFPEYDQAQAIGLGDAWYNLDGNTPPFWEIDTTVGGVSYKVYFCRGNVPADPIPEIGLGSHFSSPSNFKLRLNT